MGTAVNQQTRLAQELSEQGIKQYLANQQQKGLLRLLTCGSVDDGKSTLIGRLLHDSAQIYEDQLASLKSDSAKMGTTGEKIDLALLVDGLQAEREQGITIDVAYRYFSSDKRKFIIADTPGHEQYTRNMATGASTCDLAVILIDARYGVQTQTRRHAFIASKLGIRHFVVAINKMDLLDFDQAVFDKISEQFAGVVSELADHGAQLNVHYVPMSALDGDNVVSRSGRTPWFAGETLLEHLESVEIDRELNAQPFRFPVQYVSRPNLDFRGFAGTVAAGSVRVGDELVALPSGKRSKVASIVTFDGDKPESFSGESVTLTLEDEIDVSRGDMLCAVSKPAQSAGQLLVDLVWMAETPMVAGQLYDIKLAGKKTQARVSDVRYQLDVNSYEQHQAETLGLNGIARVVLELTETIAVDPYELCRETGALIVIDRLSNVTLGAAMVVEAVESNTGQRQFSAQELELNAYIRKHYPHWQALDISKL
ncbi:sulfate adenylyltransferase subunit CysN [Shewanella submarina]|uniref:Sulfate adenylyltransferase subunit 1 n=1 Tax=Shewanella submarina TaxID=2016376 RepID=A0ABV7GK58_9GAMM|nr:sulfate adenylyltransferase subunit CysN [Shewanella submarina]MCL1036096.1 sulfate adenylyltransferase subunit CysN [Shewanella submarina]